MQIVTDIPDKVYGVLKYFEESMGLSGKKEDENDDVKKALIRAVVNGTPLPKGHGRLIDADELKKIIQENDMLYMAGFNINLCDINNTPTIIEADKEDENADSN